MTDPQEIRRKRLAFRCWHRGTREMDLLLGSFADAHLARMSDAQLGRLEAILEVGDPQLYAWIAGRAAVPEAYDNDVMGLIKNFKLVR